MDGMPDFLANLPSAGKAKPQPIPVPPVAEKTRPVVATAESKAPEPVAELPTEDGIYFGLAEEIYHRIPRLSASGIKTLAVSPLQFWLESNFNPNRKEKDDTAARKLGRAYHKLLLEGDEAFDATYAALPSKDDYPDIIDGGDALRAECDRLGLKKGGSLLAMCDRLLEAEPGLDLWPVILREAKDKAGEKETLSKAQWEELQQVRFVLNHLPDIKGAFTNGRAEVSILWTQNGVKMKCRLDYLKPRGNLAAIIDLKSFGNIMGKPIETICGTEIGRNEYFVQPVAYTTAREAIGAKYRKQGMDVVHIVSGEAPAKEWLDSVLLPEKCQFNFVFTQTGGIPNIIACEFSPGKTFGGQGFQSNEYWMKGQTLFRNGVDRFCKYVAAFGIETPWIVQYPVRALDDVQDFKPWALEYERDLPDEQAA